MWRHYVYVHYRESDETPFYVGKGTINSKQIYKRALAPHKNEHWLNIVNKHGAFAQIVMSCKTDLEAQFWEKEIIKEIGRVNLANMTDGGDGHCGIAISDETRKKRSIAASKPRSELWIKSIRSARKNGGNGGVVKLGDKLSDSWRANLAKGKMGAKNPWFGRSSPVAKLVLNLESGIYYNTIEQAAIAHCLNPKMLYQYLDGSRINKTSLVRV